MTAWEILGLTPTSDASAIKPGYAAALKRWKQDPGNFSLDELKQAYHQLLADLSGETAPRERILPTAPSQLQEELPDPAAATELASPQLAAVRAATDKVAREIEGSGYGQATRDAISALLNIESLSTLSTRPLMEGELCKVLYESPPDWRFFGQVAELFDWSDANPFPAEQVEYRKAYDALWHHLVNRPREAQRLLGEHCHRIIEMAAKESNLPDTLAALKYLWDDEQLVNILGAAEIHSTLLTELNRVFDLDEEILLSIANYYRWNEHETKDFSDPMAARFHAIYQRSSQGAYLYVLNQLKNGVAPSGLDETQYYHAILIAKKMSRYGRDYPLEMNVSVDELRKHFSGYKPSAKVKKDKWFRRATGHSQLAQYVAIFLTFCFVLAMIFGILGSME
jgi:hypothetical protein